jgi:flagellar hook-associated protein 1
MSSLSGIGLNGGLLLGAQSMNTNRLAIETIGNNISNANTPGYSRERATITDDVISGSAGELSMGSQVTGVESLSSALLNKLVQNSLGSQGYADNQASLTSTVQDALGEQFSAASSSNTTTTTAAGDSPIQSAMTSFFGALQSLSASPTDPTARQVVVQDAQTLTSAINSAYQRLQTAQSGIAADASTVTDQINQLSTSIASLNQQITQSEAASGTTANNLRDTREQDIEQLSGLVNVTATPQSDGTVTVTLADNPSVVLVKNDDSDGSGTTQSLSVSYDANAAVPLTVSGSTSEVLGTGVPSSGSLGSDLNVANDVIGSPAASGNTGLLGQLDGVANQLKSQVNAANAAGFDLNGNAGGTIFTGTGADDLSVNSSVVNDPSLIAAGNGSGTLDGSNAQAMANIQISSSILPAFQAMVAGLGQTVSTAQTNQTTQDQVTQQLQNQRNSVSGVSIDEEMTNLINFQQSYDASARFITTISNLYEDLMNIPAT